MRRLLVVLLVMVIAFASISTAYGQVPDMQITPFFVSVSRYVNSLEVDESGNADFTLKVKPFKKEQLTEVKAIVKIVNATTGVISYNRTLNLPYSELYAQYKVSDSCILNRPGIYEFQVTYKCYGNGVLLETITANPQLDSF